MTTVDMTYVQFWQPPSKTPPLSLMPNLQKNGKFPAPGAKKANRESERPDVYEVVLDHIRPQLQQEHDANDVRGMIYHTMQENN